MGIAALRERRPTAYVCSANGEMAYTGSSGTEAYRGPQECCNVRNSGVELLDLFTGENIVRCLPRMHETHHRAEEGK